LIVEYNTRYGPTGPVAGRGEAEAAHDQIAGRLVKIARTARPYDGAPAGPAAGIDRDFGFNPTLPSVHPGRARIVGISDSPADPVGGTAAIIVAIAAGTSTTRTTALAASARPGTA